MKRTISTEPSAGERPTIKLHNINTVIALDHRDCGAYKVILGVDHTKDSNVEKVTHVTHATQLARLKDMIIQKYPKLNVVTLLMALDGNVETVG